MCMYNVYVVMASSGNRRCGEDDVSEAVKGVRGRWGGEEGGAELTPDDLARLKRVFIFPVKDVPQNLKRAWKVCCTYRTDVMYMYPYIHVHV